ncbi:hypothetical protein [Brevibacillus laterosporus]|uniref:hypothetical protein n=1 Tax=Brevibacillus laterosporus TaxID=1465 RepID=UPI003D209B1A
MKVRLGLLSVSHLANDFFNGVLVAILPLLHLYYGLTYTQMSLLVLVNNLFGGFFQPFLALFSDQREKFLADELEEDLYFFSATCF